MVFLEGLKQSFLRSQRVAIRNEFGKKLTYPKLWKLAQELAQYQLGPKMARIAINCRDPVQFAIALLATWINGSVAIPLRRAKEIARHLSFL